MPPGFPQFYVGRCEVGITLALPLPAVRLTQSCISDEVQPQRVGKWLACGRGPDEVGRDDSRRSKNLQCVSGCCSLLMTDLVKFDIGVTLEPLLKVPARLTVPQQHDPQRGQSESCAGAASLADGTASLAAGAGGVTIRVGQSFQRRSRA